MSVPHHCMMIPVQNDQSVKIKYIFMTCINLSTALPQQHSMQCVTDFSVLYTYVLYHIM